MRKWFLIVLLTVMSTPLSAQVSSWAATDKYCTGIRGHLFESWCFKPTWISTGDSINHLTFACYDLDRPYTNMIWGKSIGDNTNRALIEYRVGTNPYKTARADPDAVSNFDASWPAYNARSDHSIDEWISQIKAAESANPFGSKINISITDPHNGETLHFTYSVDGFTKAFSRLTCGR